MHRCTTHVSTDPTYDNRTIANTLKIQIRTVQLLRAQLNALDNPLEVVEQKLKAEDTARKTQTKEFIEKVQAIIDETPQRPIWQIARDLGISHTTVNACVKEDLKCRSYRRQTSQILNEKTKNLRLIKSVRLRNILKHPKKANMLWFFSDEKNFCQDQVHNSQNHRWIATNIRHMPRVMKTKFPGMVMVFGVVSSEGHIMPLHIFEVDSKVNTKVYLDVLKSVVIPWCNQVAGGRLWVWQQDSALAHKSKEPQAWFQKECNDFVPFFHWPPSSADLNPLDYFVWSYIENITNMISHDSKARLIAAICRVFAELPPTLVEKACFQFQIRIEAVIKAEGGYIE